MGRRVGRWWRRRRFLVLIGLRRGIYRYAAHGSTGACCTTSLSWLDRSDPGRDLAAVCGVLAQADAMVYSQRFAGCRDAAGRLWMARWVMGIQRPMSSRMPDVPKLTRTRGHDWWTHARAAPVDTMSLPRSGDAAGAGTACSSRRRKAIVSRMTNSIAAEGPVISGSPGMAPAIRRQRQQVKPT